MISVCANTTPQGRLPETDLARRTNRLYYRCPPCGRTTPHHFTEADETSDAGDDVLYITWWKCEQCGTLDYRFEMLTKS